MPAHFDRHLNNTSDAWCYSSVSSTLSLKLHQSGGPAANQLRRWADLGRWLVPSAVDDVTSTAESCWERWLRTRGACRRCPSWGCLRCHPCRGHPGPSAPPLTWGQTRSCEHGPVRVRHHWPEVKRGHVSTCHWSADQWLTSKYDRKHKSYIWDFQGFWKNKHLTSYEERSEQ